ncbi:germacradienol/geosmin synthase [Streptomyces sp. TLI_235]|nr:germacradienol/geosmin synthase [Streptomyces sp. TLI_235]
MLQEYLSWDLPQAAARIYPQACAEDLLLLMNLHSLVFFLGEQADPGCAARADEIAGVARELITIPFRPAGAPPLLRCPITVAWAQVWAWISAGMSEEWCDRFSSSWARALAAHAALAQLPSDGPAVELNHYLALRRATVGIFQLDAVERSGGFELPTQVSAHALMRRVRVAAADAVAWMNDIHVLERSEQRGEPYNLVTVLRHERGYSRRAAVDEAVWMTRQQLQVYQRLEAELPRMYDELWLTTDQRHAVETGISGIRHWVRGNHDWAVAAGCLGAESDPERVRRDR